MALDGTAAYQSSVTGESGYAFAAAVAVAAVVGTLRSLTKRGAGACLTTWASQPQESVYAGQEVVVAVVALVIGRGPPTWAWRIPPWLHKPAASA
jgi:hypothetical protein